MLSNASRWLTSLTAMLDPIVGLLPFFLPARLASVFAWRVTPFMAMNVGSRVLGNA